MSVSFERPVGAAADLSELEYVSALHQTQPGLVRTDGSVRDIDIVHFLLSRYGITVDVETVRNTVLVGLGGDFGGGEHRTDGDHGGDDAAKETGEKDDDDDDDDEEEGIDLAELVAVLLIPSLLKSARRDHPAAHQVGTGTGGGQHRRASVESVETGGGEGAGLIGDDGGSGKDDGGKELLDSLLPEEGLIAKVLGTMLRDVTGSSSSSMPDRPPALTPGLMRDILVSYGEEDLARDDDLLEEMVKAASPLRCEGGGGEGEVLLFDADALARALTHDVLLYDTANEFRLSSNYQDVLTAGVGGEPTGANEQQMGPPPAEITAAEDDEFVENERAEEEEADPDAEERLKLTFGASSLDFVADQYMSKNLVVLLWCGFVFVYLAYGTQSLRETQYSASFSRFDAGIASCQEEWESLQPNPIATPRYHACIDDHFMRVLVNPELYECQGGINGGPQIGCSIGKAVIRWLYTLATLMGWALLYIGVGSIGNSVRAKRRWPMVFGVIFIGGIQGWSYYNLFLRRKDYPLIYVPYDVPYYDADGELAMKSATWSVPNEATFPQNVALMHMSLFLGCCTVALQSTLLLGPSVRGWCCQRSAAAARFFTPGSIKVETKIKQAAARKVNAMVRNALKLHTSEDGEQSASFGRALVNFSLQEKTYERAGGFLWTWKSLCNGDLVAVEGIWISARICAGNVAQLFLAIGILVAMIAISSYIVQLWREGKERDDLLLHAVNWLVGTEINATAIALSAKTSSEALFGVLLNFTGGLECNETMSDVIDDLGAHNLLQSAAMNASDVCDAVHHAVSNIFYNNASGAVHDKVYDFIGSLRLGALNELVNKYSESLYPESEYMVALPLAVATAVAFSFAFVLFVTYIPSVTSTILKLRCGVIPFFHHKRNQKDLRTGMYQVTMLIGAMFWGLLVSVLLITFGVGLLVFLILWQATRNQIVGLIVQMIGLAITFTIRFLIVFFGLSGTVYAGYYRKRPTQGNFVSLLLEAANIAYTSLTAIIRAAKLILICIVYVGRLDTPLLAPGVGLGPIGDNYPAMFQRDILSHEAHRHPYIEVLGTMYMMKLRYRELFAEQAGYCFRLIFAIALMPWIRKYRILARPGSFGDEVKKNNEVLQAKNVPQSEIQGAGAENERLRVEIERLRAEIHMLRTSTGTVNGGDETSYTEMSA